MTEDTSLVDTLIAFVVVSAIALYSYARGWAACQAAVVDPNRKGV